MGLAPRDDDERHDDTMTTQTTDIETVSLWDRLDDEQRAHLTALHDKRAAQGGPDETAESRAPMRPESAFVAVAGLYNLAERRGEVLFVSPAHAHPVLRRDALLIPCPDEAALLQAYWERVARASRLITFSGYKFDGPFLMARSIDARVKPTRHLGPKWYERARLLDLREELGINNHFPAYNLDYQCRRFGIETPKKSMHGRDVGDAWRAGRVLEVAEYCFEDCRATAQLFERVAPYLPDLNWKGHVQ